MGKSMKRTALVDLDSIAFACFSGNKIPDGNGGWLRTEDGKRLLYTEKTPDEVIQACDDILTMILTDCGATDFIAFIKGKDTIKDRLAVNPQYKQDRSQEQPKYWKLCSDHFVNKWGAHLANGLETDDVLNICKLNVPDSFLCCIDSDLLGTEGTHWNWKKKEWITSTKQTEEDNLYTDMIVGTHNNVKGLPKKGKKFAEKFLKETTKEDRYKSLLDLYIESFGEEGEKEFDKNYKCIKLLTSKEGFEIPTPTKFEPVIPTIRFTGESSLPINGTLYTETFPDREDILSENWFNTIGETDRTEEIPEF
jgi:hypothetical protein